MWCSDNGVIFTSFISDAKKVSFLIAKISLPDAVTGRSVRKVPMVFAVVNPVAKPKVAAKIRRATDAAFAKRVLDLVYTL